MKKSYTPEYIIANKGLFPEEQIKQLAGVRTEVLFSELWVSDDIPLENRICFLFTLANLTNIEKKLVAVMIAETINAHLIANYPIQPAPDPEIEERADYKKYQPSLLSGFTTTLFNCKSSITEPETYLEKLPGNFKASGIITGVYSKYFKGNPRVLGVHAVADSIRMFDLSSLDDVNNYTAFIDDCAQSVIGNTVKYIARNSAEEGQVIKNAIISNGTTLVDNFIETN